MKKIRLIAALLVLVLSYESVYPQLTAEAGPDTLVCSGSTFPLGGNPTASGGTPPYTYTWSPVTNIVNCIDCPNPTALAIGSNVYFVTVTDSLGATATDSVRIIVNSMYVVNAVDSLINPSTCTGNDGQIILKGLCDFCPPSTITYYQNSTLQGPFQISGWPQMSISGLTTGLYSNIRVTSYSGCIYTLTGPYALTSPSSPVINSFTKTNVKCAGGNDGTACANISGGTQPYSYSWSNSMTQQCINGLQQGVYWVTVSDTMNCSVSGSVSITQPNPVSAFILSSTGGVPDTVCAVGIGGIPPYMYTWGSNINPLASSCFEVVSGIFAITVTDANACTTSYSLTGSLTADAGQAYICPGDQGVLGGATTARGGTPPYTYAWSPNVALSCNNCAHPLASPAVSITYYLNVTDSLGAIATDSVTVYVNDMKIDSIVTTASCFGGSNGSVCIYFSGGSPPYVWDSIGTSFPPCSGNLAPGIYPFTLWDNSCMIDTVFTIGQAPLLQIDSITSTNVSCFGGNDGTACVYASGGTPGYSYLWSPGPFQQCIVGLNADVYYVTATDANSCTATDTFTITEPTQLIVTETHIDASCYGTSTGSIDLAVSGGTPAYTYLWNNTSTTQDQLNLAAGTYTVTVTDANGCTAGTTVIINEPSPILLNLVRTGNGVYPDTIDVLVIGGCMPYSYFWGTGSITAQTSISADGTYGVTVTDACGCTVSDSISTTVNPLTVTIASAIDVVCYGMTDGIVVANATGGIPPYQYSIDGGITFQTSGVFQNLAAGIYSMIAVDSLSNSDTASFTIYQPYPLTVQILSAMGGVLPDTLDAAPNGNITPVSFQWSNGFSGQMGNVVTIDGTYSVIITDSNVCTATDSIMVGCPIPCVWPGDADYNSIADNYDLLPIGLTYGTPGTGRLNQDILWYAHTAHDWSDTLPSGVNYKHSDCDGSGIVNYADTVAILQNFGLTHAKNSGKKEWKFTDPALQVDLVPDTAHAGDTMFANLTLGDVNIPANNVYGLAFTVNYDVTVVDTSKTTVTFGNSWMGTSTDKISIAKDLKSNGQLKCGITRIDHFTRSGYGQIGQATFVITTDNINGKNQFAYYQTQAWISDLVAIDNLGNIITVNEGSDSAQVEFVTTGIEQLRMTKYELRINPNPTEGDVQLLVSENLVGREIKLLDVVGRMLLKMPIASRNSELATRNFHNGVYFVQVVTEKGALTKRLVIAR